MEVSLIITVTYNFGLNCRENSHLGVILSITSLLQVWSDQQHHSP